MISEILKADSITGWTASTGAAITGTSTIQVASNNSASLLFNFGSAIGTYVKYTFGTPIVIGDYQDLVFHIGGQNFVKQEYLKPEDFAYSIELGTGKTYYLKVFETFCDVAIQLTGLTTIEYIKITKLVDGIDNLNVSSFILHKQQLPLDIFAGLKKQIEYIRDANAKIELNTITITAGDTGVTLTSDTPYIDRYCCVEITNGTLSEIHQIEYKDGLTIQFNDMYSGKTIINSMTGAKLYLYFPVEYGITQKTALVPSITIWSMEPENIEITNALSNVIDNYNSDGTFRERCEGLYQEYSIFLDCQARQNGILAALSELVRKTIGRKIIWCGGRKFIIEFDGKAIETEPIEGFDIIPKIEYRCKVQVKEDIFDNVLLPKTVETIIDYTIN